MAPLIGLLLKSGLDLVANATIAKGKEWVEEKTGIEITDDLSDDKLTELKQFQLENETELRRLMVEDNRISAELEMAYLGDKDSARRMQIAALQQDDIFSKRFLYWFAIGWSVFSGLYIGLITFITIPENNIRFVDTVLGFILGTLVATIIQFFFGSSKGSDHKNGMMMDLIKKVGREGN